MITHKISQTLLLKRASAWSLAVPFVLAAQLCLASADITFTADVIYPEGVTWSAKQNVFFVGSITRGIVGTVTKQGKYKPFITDKKLIASIGLKVDAKRNLLWVANSDSGASDRSSAATQDKLAAVASYNATTGEEVGYYDLSGLVDGDHFVNDLALDNNGNVYATDSFSPVIYRIDTSGKATIFAKSDLFKGEGFNLNGIVYHPDGFLLVGKHNSGELFRVSMKDPTNVLRVETPEVFKGVDGLLLRKPNQLLVVQNNGANRMLNLVSNDGWKSATIKDQQKSVMSFPTTATQAGKDFYVLNARLDTLLGKDTPKASEYVLQKY